MSINRFENKLLSELTKIANKNISELSKILNMTKISQTVYGYIAGGYNGSSYLNTIEKLNFDTKTAAALSATLAVARGAMGTGNTSTYGFFFAGSVFPPAYRVSEIDGINMTNDTSINPSSTLSQAKQSLGAPHNGTTYAYPGYGYSSGNVKNIEKFNYNTWARSNLTSIGTARHWIGNLSSPSTSNGYYLGGTTGSYSKEVDRVNFNNDAVANMGNVLVTARISMGCINSINNGYLCGGGIPGVAYDKGMEKMVFLNESFVNIGNKLSIGIGGQTHKSPTNYERGFLCAGTKEGGILTNYIMEFVVSTEICSLLSSTLTSAKDAAEGVQSGGYL